MNAYNSLIVLIVLGFERGAGHLSGGYGVPILGQPLELFCTLTGEVAIYYGVILKKTAANFMQIPLFESNSNATFYDPDVRSRLSAVVTVTSASSRTVTVKFRTLECIDNGVYNWEISVFTNQTVEFKYEHTLTLTVIPQFGSNDGYNITYYPATNLVEGDTVNFTCQGDVGNTPVVNMLWFYYLNGSTTAVNVSNKAIAGAPQDSTVAGRTCSKTRLSTLALTLTKQMHWFVVWCTVDQNQPDALGQGYKMTQHINIMYKPTISSLRKVPDAVQYTEGDALLTLTCTATSNPPPQYYWTYELVFTNRTLIGIGNQLVLRNLNLNSTGVYTCVAYNLIKGVNQTTNASTHITVAAACGKGNYINVASQTCLPCPVDTYNDKENQLMCISCVPPKQTMGTGSDELSDCRIVACPRIEMKVDRQLLTFPAARIGETGYSRERCYSVNKALATADCTGSNETGAEWRNILLSPACGTVPDYNQSSSTNSLRNLSKESNQSFTLYLDLGPYIFNTPRTKYERDILELSLRSLGLKTTINENNYVEILRNTVNLTSPDINVTEADVIYTADILSNFNDANLKIDNAVLSSVLKIANNMLLSDREAINNAQKITNAANRIVNSVDDLTNRIELPPLIDRNESASIVEDFIASQVWLQRGDGRVVIGISVYSDSDRKIKPDSLTPLVNESGLQFNETDAAIFLTDNLVKGNLTKLAFHVYSRTYLFSDSSNRYVVQSSVAAARLNRNNREVRDLGNEFVTAVFHVAEPHANLVCAYWDYDANEAAGGWRTDGCNMTRDDNDDDNDVIVCKCNHLTNFAVLVDLKANSELSETDKLALGIITKVGLILSIIGLGLTIVTFLIFKHLRNGRGQQVLVNLSVSMLCSAILFLVGMDRTSSYGGCITVAVLLHYFILVSFMWMLVEGVLQYLRFVKVLGTYIPYFMMKSMIPAWGIPLIPVIVILAVDYDMYYGGKGYCWLSRSPMIYGFIIPVAAIILSNIIVFTMVMCNLLRRNNKNMASNQSERKMAFLHFQAAVSIFFVLGLSWVFGFLTVDDTRIAFHYLFAIFNAFQGLFTFLLFTAREKQIRNAWRKLCCGRSQYKATTSGLEDARRKYSNGDNNSTGLSESDKGRDLSRIR